MNIGIVSNTLRLREYYYMVLRHKLVLGLAIILSMTVAAVIAVTSPKIYRSEAVLIVEDEHILNPLISGLAVTPSAGARMRALRERLLSWPRLTLLAEKMGLDKGITNPLEYERMINLLRDQIQIRMRGNGIITVSHEGAMPRKSQEIVETLTGIIEEGTITSTNLQANSAIQFIEEQMELYRGKLETSEENLREFQEIYSSTLPLATRMNEQLVALKMELQGLLVNNTDKHPRVIQTRDLIKRLEEERTLQFRKAKEAGLDVTDETFAELVSSVPLQQQQLAKLQRDYQVNNSIYQQLAQKLETAKISQTLENSDKGLKFKTLEPARLPLLPVKPNRVLIMLAGFFAGAGLGVILIFIIELSNTSIRNVEEAEQLLELPIFGAIATIKPEELILGERLRADAGL